MFNAIFAIFSTLFTFGAGSAGIMPKASLPKVPVETFSRVACYNPQPEVKLTLTWPDDFSNVPDRRPELNPSVWGDKGLSSFNTDNSCLTIAMGGKTQRRYIRVRQETRIPSCKVDELAGPYASGTCPGWSNDAPELTHRGTCALDGYTDLRKIAEKKDANGNLLEIFWNPFSHNVGCNYDQNNENCGPGQRRNINLKDFIYVLRRRDAFDPGRPQDSRPGCPARWDAGATNEEACSHFFDVYMAEDFYQATKSAPATSDPESPYYFVKQVLENCQEDTTFIPAPEANLTMPPIFIKTPFVAQNQPTSSSFDKIIPSAASENANYLTYIWGRPDLVVPAKTNLLLTSNPDNAKPLKICKGGSFKASMKTLAENTTPPTIAPLADCHDPLGNIYFKDDKGATVNFKVFSKPTTPQTFYLLKSDDEKKTYIYTPTEKDYPTNTENDPSLQLRVMRMISKNAWTWATPWCKPAIYMYPDKPTLVNVKLDLDGQLSVSRPRYNPQNGWSVVAYPDGSLKDPLTLNDYPYLYYEADLKGITIPKEGFVYSREDLPGSLRLLMEKIGFNEKETADFLSYWLPRLNDKPYYFVTLLPENVINDKEKLTFSMTPDTIIRSRFVFEGLDAPIRVRPLATLRSDPVSRVGFSVTDWGGTIVGKSCTDITVK